MTKCDVDGLACDLLLKGVELIDRIASAHPKAIESGIVDITAGGT